MNRTTQKGLTQKDTDRICREIWADLENVPFDETDDGRLVLSEQFQSWPKGTSRSEIWTWLDRNYSKGICALLYGEGNA